VSLAKWNVNSFYRGRDFLLLKKRFCQLNAPPTLRAASRKLSRQMCLYSLFSSFSDLQEEQFGAVVLSSCLSYLLQIVNKIFIYHLMCQTSLLYFSFLFPQVLQFGASFLLSILFFLLSCRFVIKVSMYIIKVFILIFFLQCNIFPDFPSFFNIL